MAKDSDKQQKREAKAIRERARAAHEGGDYKTSRALNLQVAQMVPDTELGRTAAKDAENVRLDPGALYAGAGAAVLYLIAWLIAS